MPRNLREALRRNDEHRQKPENTRNPNSPAERSEKDDPPKKIRVISKYDRDY